MDQRPRQLGNGTYRLTPVADGQAQVQALRLHRQAVLVDCARHPGVQAHLLEQSLNKIFGDLGLRLQIHGLHLSPLSIASAIVFVRRFYRRIPGHLLATPVPARLRVLEFLVFFGL